MSLLLQPEHRGHRWLGEQLDLWHFPEHAPGMCCWHPRGLRVLRALQAFVRELCDDAGYQEVSAPLLCSHELWAASGHLDKFRDKMFHVDVDGRPAALRPMNCPGHCDYFAQRPRSYRELPLRVAEHGHVHRFEQSGELNGLLRARSFHIDDGHVFCAPDGVAKELAACLALAGRVYRQFGFEPEAELSLRPDKRLGSDELWDQAESALADALDAAGIAYSVSPGEGAFYGPKVDLHLRDSLGRAWQMGSVQLDYQLPDRLDLRYVGADGSDVLPDGQPRRPVVIHRALLGSFERFVAVLVEHCDGRFPLWLAPEAVRVLPVGAGHADYAQRFAADLRAAGVRAQVDADGPLGGRVRRASGNRVPVLAVIGDREQAAGEVMLRRADARDVVGAADAVAALAAEVRERR